MQRRPGEQLTAYQAHADLSGADRVGRRARCNRQRSIAACPDAPPRRSETAFGRSAKSPRLLTQAVPRTVFRTSLTFTNGFLYNDDIR